MTHEDCKSTFEQELNDEFDNDLQINGAFKEYANQCSSSMNESAIWFDGAKATHQIKDDDEDDDEDEEKKGANLRVKRVRFSKDMRIKAKDDDQTKNWKKFLNDSSSDDESDDEDLAERTENDQLLYDPKADDKDQAFVDSLRAAATFEFQAERNRRPTAKAETKTLSGQLGPTDAILNCPCCMTQLCLDCQRHQTYLTQYRAMFVHNCRVDTSNEVTVKEKRKRRKLNRNRSEDENKQCDEKFYSLLCEICSAQVGAFDANEQIYHFYNVIASHS